MKMTRRRRRCCRKQKGYNSKEGSNLSLQSDCQNTTSKTSVDGNSKSPARKSATPSLEHGGPQPAEESSDKGSRKHHRGESRSNMELDALDYKVDKTEDKITFQALIKQALAENVSVTIEHSELNPEIIENIRIIFQQQPLCKAKASNSEQEATAKARSKSSSVKVEIKSISFSGDGSTFMLGNKNDECSRCQRHNMLSSCSAALNNWECDQQNDQSPWPEFRITTNDKELKVSEENYVSCRNNIPICEQNYYEKFTYEEKYNNETLHYPKDHPSAKGSCHSYILKHAVDCACNPNLLNDCALTIPPPIEFADGSEDIELLPETQGSKCLIQEKHNSESDVSHGTSACCESYLSSNWKEMVGNARPQSSHVDVNHKCTIFDKWERLSEYGHSVRVLEPLGSSSAKNDLSKNKNRCRNNSIDNVEGIRAPSICQIQPRLRRKTYPHSDSMDVSLQMEWKDIANLPHQSQPHALHTVPPFFTQTLPRKQGKPERVSSEDMRSFLCFQGYKQNCKDSCDRSRFSCWSSSDTLSPMKSRDLSPEMQGRVDDSPFGFQSEENVDDVFCLSPITKSEFEGRTDIFRTDLCPHQDTLPEERMKDVTKRDMDSWQSTDPQEQGDFTESGFDEETLDGDYPSDLVGDIASANEQFQIQITSSSPSDHTPNNAQETANVFDTISKVDSGIRAKTEDTTTEVKKRRHSVTILQIGALDQRSIIQNNNRKIENIDASQHFSAFREFNEDDMIFNESNRADGSDLEQESTSSDTVGDIQTLLATECLSQVSLPTLRDDCEQNHEKTVPSAYEESDDEPSKSNHCNTATSAIQQNNKQHNNTECSTQQGGNAQNLAKGYETLNKNMDEFLKMTPTRENCLLEDTQQQDCAAPSERKNEEINCHMSAQATKQTWQQDLEAEASCLLQLPGDSVQRDDTTSENGPVAPLAREGSEYWAKRRKQYKESKQCSSTGGTSGISNQESVNSEETRSMDLAQVRAENEQRGIYTETYNSTSWIFSGDEGNPENNRRSLGKRAHRAAIRERTVKIAKGTGDYPWGFRIQFSKPILVTEVDTNGAAEEAGLQIGDVVLVVNGTDVTSIPHSEAATLARQGPDILTLVVGSDISRCPNTPRPACRGYLYKRTQSALLKGWRKRWFVLKHNGLFYYYKNKMDEGRCRPLDVMRLEGAEVGVDNSLGKPFVFKCFLQSRNRMLNFCSTSNQEMKRWLEAMERAIHPVHQTHVWVDVTHHNANLPSLAIKSPECLGLLYQVDKNKTVWAQHYCVLKDACLYFYAGIRSTLALGGIYLQGYTVSEQSFGSKRTIIEAKPPSEEFKTFYLCADNAADNKRWIMALKASISKWLPLHQAIHDFITNPPEETRM